jgi:L-asparaginase
LERLPLVKVIGVGGTIAMKYDLVRKGYVPAVTEEELLALVPGLESSARVSSEQFSNIPSDWMTPETWLSLAHHVNEVLALDDVRGVTITHGTDTLEDTTYFLSLTVRSDKPVTLTGAQRTITEQDFDGPRNLGDAIRVAAAESSQGRGVMLVFDGKIYPPDGVVKRHTTRVDAFEAGEYGILGDLFTGSVRYLQAPRPHPQLFDVTTAKSLPRVDVFICYPGVDPDLLAPYEQGLAPGLVVQAFGAGNLHNLVYERLRPVIASGTTVVISSRVLNGGVLPMYGFDGGGMTLKGIGALSAGLLTTHKARTLLMMCLSQPGGQDLAKERFAWAQ